LRSYAAPHSWRSVASKGERIADFVRSWHAA